MNLTTIILIIVTVLVVGIGAILAVFINTVIPEMLYNKRPVKETSEDVDKRYEDLEAITTTTVGSNNTTTTEITRAKLVDSETIQKYPFVVSVSVPLYLDDLKTYIFSCTGVIIDSSHVLTSTVCLFHYNPKEMKNFGVVRSGSDYIAKGGTAHIIVEVLQLNGMALLGVMPEFQYPAIKVYTGQEYETEFLSIGWDKKLPREEAISTTEWYSLRHQQCDNKKSDLNGIWGESHPETELTGRPLITAKTKELVGIEYEYEASNELRYFKRYNLEMATLIGQANENSYNIKHVTEKICVPASPTT